MEAVFLRMMTYLTSSFAALKMPFALLPWSLMFLWHPSAMLRQFKACVRDQKDLEPLRRESAQNGKGYLYW